MEKTLEKGLSVLELLAESDQPRGVSDIARNLRLSRSNTHRLLQTLRCLGYTVSTEGKYSLTPKFWVLGAGVMSRLDVRRLAMSDLEKLAEQTLETVHLSIFDMEEVIYIEKIESPQPIRAYTKIGGSAPAYCVATGKALLAFQREEVVEGIAQRLQKYTERTIVDGNTLRAELARIREAGYAVNLGEWREQIGGIGAPVFDVTGAPVAALGTSGPVERMTSASIARIAPLVYEAARNVSRKMGAPGLSAVALARGDQGHD